MGKRLIFIVCCWVSIGYASAQEQVRILPFEKNLSQSTVTSLLQDHKGILWIGTRSGLNRYDGGHVDTYYFSQDDTTSLSDNYIRCIFQDRNESIWLGTDAGGLCRYDEHSDAFIRYHPDGKPLRSRRSSVFSIVETADGHLWVGTQNEGLYRWEIKGSEIVRYQANANHQGAISSNHITQMAVDDNDNLWVATRDNGLNLYNTESDSFTPFQAQLPDGISSNEVRSLHMGRYTQSIYVGTNNGLDVISYDKNSEGYTVENAIWPMKKRTPVLSILELENGEYWVGTENQGILSFQEEKGQVLNQTISSLESASVWTLLADQQGRTWIGTFNKGLFRQDPSIRKFDLHRHETFNPKSLSASSISAFAELNDETIWVGTDGKGLCRWDRNSNEFSRVDPALGFKAPSQVLSLYVDEAKNLWVGSWNDGLWVKEKNSLSFKRVELKLDGWESQSLTIMDIDEDANGNLWLAAYRAGLVVIRDRENRTTELSAEKIKVHSDLVRDVHVLSTESIWVGTEDKGLIHIEQLDGNKNVQTSKLPNSTILTLKQGVRNELLVGTTRGLVVFDTEGDSAVTWDRLRGLPDETIYAIETDDEGNIWLSSNAGLSRLDSQREVVRNFNRKDGLQHMEFFKNASLVMSSGEMLFGGISGFNAFMPENFQQRDQEAKLYIKKFEYLKNAKPAVITSASLQANSTIDLSHDQNDFTISYSLIDLGQTDGVRYRYRLSGFDDDWRDVGGELEAYYTNIAPGRYQFQLVSTNRYGVWQPTVASLLINISPPWYANFWAYAIYILVVAGLSIYVVRSIFKRERLQTQLKLEQIELAKMQEVDEMKTNFFTNISHELRSPLTLIHGPLKELVSDKTIGEQQKGVLANMIKHTQRLIKLINELLDLAKLESGNAQLKVSAQDLNEFVKGIVKSHADLAAQKYISVKMNLAAYQGQVYFDTEKMEKILSNLVGNAIKFTPEFGDIICEIKDEPTKLVLTIVDSGPGIPHAELPHIFERFYRADNGGMGQKVEGTGIGLALTKELVELHGGWISVSSELGNGTEFELILKKGVAHYDNMTNVSLVQAERISTTRERSSSEIEEVKDTNPSEYEHEHTAPSILVIENNNELRSFVTQVLASRYKVIQAVNGEEGISFALNQVPDLIISDVMMDGIDGYEVCNTLKTDNRTAAIPIILLTAKASQESKIEGFAKGADHYLLKPFDPEELLLNVKNALTHGQKVREANRLIQGLFAGPEHVKLDSKDDLLIKYAVRIIEEHISDSRFQVDYLAKELGYSRMQLYRKLKAIVGMSANEFIRSIRLKRAAQLIAQNQLTISEVTYQVGFNDHQYFRDCFKKEFGVTPSDFGKGSIKS